MAKQVIKIRTYRRRKVGKGSPYKTCPTCKGEGRIKK